MILSKGRLPPTDGVEKYHLPVAPGVVMHGRTLDDLQKNVFEYRIRNHIDPGDIEKDINDYYCAKWPSFCHTDKNGLGQSERAKAAELLNRVARWVSGLIQRMPRGGYEIVLPQVAESRAEICAQCPKNGNWRSGCGGCDAATLALLQQVKQLRKTSLDGNLRACAVGWWELSAAVQLPAECTPITEEQRAAMPAPCWRKAIP